MGKFYKNILDRKLSDFKIKRTEDTDKALKEIKIHLDSKNDNLKR